MAKVPPWAVHGFNLGVSALGGRGQAAGSHCLGCSVSLPLTSCPPGGARSCPPIKLYEAARLEQARPALALALTLTLTPTPTLTTDPNFDLTLA